MDRGRLERQIDFIMQIDRLKTVFRRTYLTDTSRFENSAEHSWHIAVMAMILAEYANDEKPDLLKVIQMLLIHDLVEIDTGDTYIYDKNAGADKQKREQAAAKRLFSLLPADQASAFTELWHEFEAGQTQEAKFAKALDRLQPLLHNLYTHGKSWKEHGVRKDQVVDINCGIADGALSLWDFAAEQVKKAVHQGDLPE
jgi:putative hydrolases of HD superfamily